MADPRITMLAPITVWIACKLVCLASARTLRLGADYPDDADYPGQADELWLDDLTKDYLYDMQGDSPGGGWGSYKVGVCPPPLERPALPTCKASRCGSDMDCDQQLKCCYNGCVFTCMATSPEPPVIDWRREPPRIFKSGYSWLVAGAEDSKAGEQEVEWCSTTVLYDDEDALLCPHGFQCHIEDPGDPDNEIPNKGRCVKEQPFPTDAGRKFQIKTSSRADGSCELQGRVLHKGARFRYHQHACHCLSGNVECVVRR